MAFRFTSSSIALNPFESNQNRSAESILKYIPAYHVFITNRRWGAPGRRRTTRYTTCLLGGEIRREAGNRKQAGKVVTFGRGNVDISGTGVEEKQVVEQARKEFRRKGGGGCEMQARMQRWCGESGPVSGLRSLFIPTLLRAVDGS
ncbi:uncharacterized protein LOC116185410 [Apis dorsata]|uniref:uncharacterized protein LOC116185410 n=1 Tax=Apis dorsata TaxID=7462 RepID=UPI0012939378|nr:uncharacterized protein LOC116185410 [Apis dorsata]